MRTVAAVAVSAMLATAFPALAQTLTGAAEVVDSDRLVLEGYNVFLVGVESVEADQTCDIGGEEWECYSAAVRALQTIVGQGTTTCEVLSGPNFLDELTARCEVAGSDVGAQFVGTGFGLAISSETHDYDAAQKVAQDSGIGLWQSSFTSPGEWRQANSIFADRPSFRPDTAGQ